MESVWHFLDFCDVHTEDGAPVEVRASCVPSSAEEDLLLARIELEFGLWLVWEDAWRKDGDRVRRPVDLARAQPSHKITFRPDDGGTGQVWTVTVDRHANSACASAWTKHEWFSGEYQNSGRWSRNSDGWYHGGTRTPEGRSGILCIEPLPPGPVSMRRSR